MSTFEYLFNPRSIAVIGASPEANRPGAQTIRALQDNGKITVPAIVRGTAQKYQIEIDTTALARRALTNEAKTQATDAVKRGLGGLLRR